MMKIRYIAPMALACALLFTACGAKTDASDAVSAVNDAVGLFAGNDVSADASAGEAADAKVVYGEIGEVIGNSITIKLVEQPQRVQFDPSNMPEGFDPANMPEGGARLNPENMPEGFDPANMPEGGFTTRGGADGGTRGGNITRNEDGTVTITNADGTTQTIDPSAMAGQGIPGGGRQMERQYTGETAEVMIPTGLPVMTRTRGESGMEEKEISVNKLAAGDMITVTYKADGKNIDTVYVTQAGAAGGGMFFGGQGMPEGGGMGFRLSDDGGATFYQAAPAN